MVYKKDIRTVETKVNKELFSLLFPKYQTRMKLPSSTFGRTSLGISNFWNSQPQEVIAIGTDGF